MNFDLARGAFNFSHKSGPLKIWRIIVIRKPHWQIWESVKQRSVEVDSKPATAIFTKEK